MRTTTHVEGHFGGGGPDLEVGLVQGRAVDGEGAPAVGDDVVPGHADDPLDEVVAGVLGQEVDEDEGVANDATQAGGVLDVEPDLVNRVKIYVAMLLKEFLVIISQNVCKH